MVSTFTPNLGLEEPAHGDQAGTWDRPVNANWTLLDAVLGGVTTVALSTATTLTLATSQYQNRQIVFTSTLAANVTVTFPTSFQKTWEIQHSATGSSAFTITLATTAAGAQAIAIPPGELIDVQIAAGNVKFKNLHRVGKYWDYAGSSVPNWVSACTVPPYLNCDGTAFSSATYPQLALKLGGTTLPDSRGRARCNVNAGTSRMTTAGSGVNGDVLLSGGGGETQTLTASQIPTLTAAGNNILNTNQTNIIRSPAGFISDVNEGPAAPFGTVLANGATLYQPSFIGTASVTSNNTSPGAHSNVQPTIIHGLTLIRAA